MMRLLVLIGIAWVSANAATPASPHTPVSTHTPAPPAPPTPPPQAKATTKWRLPGQAASLQMSPDGKWIACWVWPPGGNEPLELWISPTRRPQWRRLGEGVEGGSWRGDSRAYVYAAGRDDNLRQLTILKVPQLTQRKLRLRYKMLGPPTWSRDGKLIAFMVARRLPRKATYPPIYNRLVVTNRRGRIRQVFLLAPPRGKYTYLVPSPPLWSPGGRKLALMKFNESGISNGEPLVIDRRSGRQRYVPLNAALAFNLAAVHKWLFCESTAASGECGVFATSFNRPRQKDFLIRNTFNGTSGIGWSLGTVCATKGDRFYIVLYRSDFPQSERSELWLGECKSRPRLLKRLAWFRGGTVAIDTAHRRLWIVDESYKTIRIAPLPKSG